MCMPRKHSCEHCQFDQVYDVMKAFGMLAAMYIRRQLFLLIVSEEQTNMASQWEAQILSMLYEYRYIYVTAI